MSEKQKTVKEKEGLTSEEKRAYGNILTTIRNYSGIDFRHYKEGTILRRIQKRMGMRQINSMNEYLDILLTTDEEKAELAQDLLIGVTAFFRDEEAFRSLYQNVFPPLFCGKNKELRIWCAACSTGEEAYSLAILLEEYMKRSGKSSKVKIFATDIDREAIYTAQAGVYLAEQLEMFTKEQRDTYFTELENGYQIKEKVRNMIVFANHDMLRDAPFSHMDMIICRNVFIYIKADMQAHIISTFYKMLNDDGFLFLGNSESLGKVSGSFVCKDKKWKIYQKDATKEEEIGKEYMTIVDRGGYSVSAYGSLNTSKKIDMMNFLEKALEAVLDSAFLIRNTGEIIRTFKDVNRYLHINDGQFDKQISTCLLGELATVVSSMMSALRSQEKKVLYQKLCGIKEFQNEVLCIRTDCLICDGLEYFLVQIHTDDKTEEISNVPATKADELKSLRIEELEKALQESNAKLQSAIEDLETKNEELQSSNEEMIVANEELQSTNEQMQSVNEELYTVNSEYQNKIDELIKANTDFDNLLMNAEIGALYIDDDLCIRKITPIIGKNTNLLLADTGRPIAHVLFMNEYPDFVEDVTRCKNNGEIIEREIQKQEITWLVRLRPYYNTKGIAGVMVILFDITKRLEAAKYELQLLIDSVPGGVARMRYDGGLIVEYMNDGLCHMMQMDRNLFAKEYHNHYEKLIDGEDWETVKKAIEQGIQSREMVRVEYRAKGEGRLVQWRLMQAIVMEQDDKPTLQCTITNITEQKNAQTQMDSLIENMPNGILRVFYDGKTPQIVYASDATFAIIGYTKEEYLKRRSSEAQGGLFVFQKYEKEVRESLDGAFQGEHIARKEYQLNYKDGSSVWIDMRGEVVARTEAGVLIQYVINDITESKKAFMEMRREKRKLDIIAEISADLIFEYDARRDSIYYTKQTDRLLNASKKVDNYIAQLRNLSMTHPDDDEQVKDFCDQMTGGKMFVHTEMRMLYADRKYHWVEIEGRTIYDEDGIVDRIIGKICNIDERKEREENLQKRSEMDSLTGLYNQVTSKLQISRSLSRIRAGEEYYLLICDIDNFKKVNDTNGHLFGDAVLCTFADEIRNTFPGAIKGRIGGDEFILLVKNIDKEELQRRLVAFNERFKTLYDGTESGLEISCSVGIAICNYKEHKYDKAFHCADSALYRVKNNGKKTYLFAELGTDWENQQPGYLHSQNQDTNQYIREEALVKNDEDLILFSLELLDNVADMMSGLRMVADRVCRFFDFEDIMYFVETTPGAHEVIYRLGNLELKPIARNRWDNKRHGWNEIRKRFDEQGIAILNKNDVEEVMKSKAGSIMFIKTQEKNGTPGLIMFLDRKGKKTWENEKGTLYRISSIIFNRIQQLREEEHNREEIEFKTNYDSVTKLPHYFKFLSLAEKYLNEKLNSKAAGDKSFYFVYSDFSNFQYLNEVYGYMTGDATLKAFGEALRKYRRCIYTARVTSDHFVSLVECAKDFDITKEFLQLTEKFCKDLNKRYTLCNLIMISGIYKVEGEYGSISALVDCANNARKYGKHMAETTCIMYTNEIKEQAENVSAIVANMVSGLENKEFTAFLQPKVDLTSGKVVGAEALVRWIKQDGTMLRPDQFVPIFENNGFITKIDFAVFEQVLSYLQTMKEKQEELVPISVNFSRHHAEEDEFMEKFVDRLNRFDVDPHLIEVEVTETIYSCDLEKLVRMHRGLNALGVKISIDDFGSGYSSLNILSKVEADYIKLDKQFLDGLDRNDRSPEFIKHLIMMIRQLGFQIVAEGVETKEQIDMLKEAGCDIVQGYYYAKPMPFEEFRKFLKNFNKERE